MVAEKNIMKPRTTRRNEPKEFEERVIEVARISRVVKGGRRIRFRALVVLGDMNGRVGMGVAKANEVAVAVRKASSQAKKNIINVPIIEGTIPHEVFMKHCGAEIMLKPASSGTSIVAGGSIRSVAELAGISDLLAKSFGSSNKINSVTAAIKALSSFNPEIVQKVRSFSAKVKSTEKPAAKHEDQTVTKKPQAVKKDTDKKSSSTKNNTKKNSVKKDK